MKKILLILGTIVLGIAVIIIAVGVYRFNFTNDDIYFSTGEKIEAKDTTYIINGQAVTLKNGLAEAPAASGSASQVITRYFGNEASGDLNNDGQADSAFLLTQETGGSGIFYYITATIKEGDENIGLNAALLGDRIAPQTTEIKDGKIIVNYADRKVDEPMSARPSVGISRYFQVVNRQLIEVKNPAISELSDAFSTSTVSTNITPNMAVGLANPASLNCSKLGGSLVIEKRGDGGEYGLCYFEDNRACEEWALMRGDCPLGGVKTTGFDTVDQKYCAWSGGETFAVSNSVCTFKNGQKCSTLDFYNGACSSVE